MKRQYLRSAFSIFLLLALSFALVPVGALQNDGEFTTDFEASTALQNDIIDVVEETFISDNERDAFAENDVSAITTSTSYTGVNRNNIPDGVYALQNYGNSGLWMDIERNLTTAGAHVQQCTYSTSPANVGGAYGLFKITQVGTTGRYIIRLLLNTNLSFGFDGTSVLTKTIPASDSDVSASDTFYITYASGGYLIRPYGSSYYICANNTTASGMSGAPDSYLTKKYYSAAGDQAKWILEGYDTPVSDGIYAFRNLGNENRWMDIERNITTPGAHLQQFSFDDNSPASVYSASGLFRVTQIDNSGRYVIRSMLNEALGLDCSSTDSYVYTKSIALIDQNVDISNTYYVKFHNGGYIIVPYGSSTVVAANNTDASGYSGVPDSYLKRKTLSAAGDCARWSIECYTDMVDEGLYWLSNQTNLSSTYRVMDARGPSYAEGTVIQQWQEAGEPSSSAYAQRWIIRHVGCGYYTIASSKKHHMFISKNGSSLQLTECYPDELSETSSILWKIEGSDQSGYTITNKAGSTYSITAPTNTTSGTALVLTSASSGGTRSKWTLNRIDDVYIVSIYSIYPTNSEDSSSSVTNLGHSWIKFENLAIENVQFGQANVESGEYVTVGKWGNQSPKQMWYNLELTLCSDMNTTTRGGYISVLIGPDELEDINDYIEQSYDKEWSVSHTCANLACDIWNSFQPNSDYTTNRPRVLINHMKTNSFYVSQIFLFESTYQGYQTANRMVFVQKSNIAN